MQRRLRKSHRLVADGFLWASESAEALHYPKYMRYARSKNYPSPLACNDKPLMRFDKHLFVVVAREPEHSADTIPAIDCGALWRFQAIN
jgi:hypothetical protein